MMDLLAREDWQVDAVIPVPISSSRRTERGYNQAALLARPVALQAGLEYKPHQLEKVRDTRSQVHLSAVERRTNVAGAFAARGSVSGLNILVIDDVTTSGATLNECAAALFSAGAAHVYGLTLARAERVIHS